MCAIQGLTSCVAPAFARIGRLYKGGKKRLSQSGKEFPGQELEYFRFEAEDPAVMAAFRTAYGDKPDRIRVILPFATADEVFSTWMEAWFAGGLMHRCDGRTMLLWRDPDTGEMHQEPRPCDGLTCHQVGRLEVIVPELLQAGHLGTVVLGTHSKHDLMALTASLRAAELVCGSRPRGLFGVMGVITRRKAKISTPAGDGKRASREKWLVSFSLEAGWVQDQLALAYERRAPLQLAPPEETWGRGDGRRVDPSTGEISGGDSEPTGGDEHRARPQPERAPASSAPAQSGAPTDKKMPAGRPWAAEKVLQVLRHYVEQEGERGNVPPDEDALDACQDTLEVLVGIGQAEPILQVVFGQASWEGLSRAQVAAIGKKWLLIGRAGAIGNPAAVEEARAVLATAGSPGYNAPVIAQEPVPGAVEGVLI